jgi:hypothetical protein
MEMITAGGITFDPAKPPQKLTEKLARIAAEIGGLEKRGFNDHFNYAFLLESDIEDALRAKLAEAKVFIFAGNNRIVGREKIGESAKGNPKLLTDVEVSILISDAESGEWVVLTGVGTGEDNSDKGTYKAITGAVKYLLIKSFRLSTGDDPEETREARDKSKVRTKQGKVEVPPCGVCGKPITATTWNNKPVTPQVVAATTRQKFGASMCDACAQARAKKGPAPEPSASKNPDGTERIAGQITGIEWKTSTGKNKAQYAKISLFGGIVVFDYHKSHQQYLAKAKKGEQIIVITKARMSAGTLYRDVERLVQCAGIEFGNDGLPVPGDLD